MTFNYEQWKQAQFGAVEQQQQHSAVITFPASVAWAGIIWATIGVVTILAIVLSSPAGTVRSPGTVLGGVFFLYGGIRAASGTTPGTRGSGIGSILLGSLWLGVGVMLQSVPGRNEIALLVNCAFGGAFVVAGILAVAGDANYQKWRAAQAARGSRSGVQ
jgi:hypothetical protein